MGARSSLASDLLAAQQSKYLADFTFTLANGTAIKTHKLLLIARVPAFVKELPDAMCNAANVPPEVTTSEADFSAVLGFLCVIVFDFPAKKT